MYPRRIIIPNRSLTHLYFRCHNQSFLFEDPEVKKHIIKLWAKYKTRYGMRIFDFNIMDNHAHLVARAENADYLGDFMRTVNFQIARFINKRLKRDSQVLRERYKSKVVCDQSYFLSLIDYVWVNRYDVDRRAKPEKDPFCSAAWRLNADLTERFSNDEKELVLLNNLLDPYEAAGIDTKGNVEKFVTDRLNAVKSKMKEFPKLKDMMTACAHTLGDKLAVAFRTELISAYRRNLDLSRERPT